MAPPIAASAVVACLPDLRNTTTATVGASSGSGSIAGAAGGFPASGSSGGGKACHITEDTIKLIECVKARPALWHRKHLRQRVQVAHRGWEEIRKAFKADEVSSLKVRWKTLRDSFRREVKRIEDGEISTSSWPLFHRMSFLIGHFRTRESYYKSGSLSPEHAKELEPSWNYSEGKSNSQTDEVASSSVAESEGELVESITLYAPSKMQIIETVVPSNTDRVEVNNGAVAAGAAEIDSDPEDLTVIETIETVVQETDGDEAIEDMEIEPSRSDEVIELPPHMYGEVTFKNKLRARIKTEPVDGEQRSSTSFGREGRMESDADYNFLMSLYPFMKKLTGRRNLEVRIKIQQLIADAMGDD